MGKSKPEPGIAILRGEIEDYDKREATAADAVLIVEVSESTLEFDRAGRLSMYARGGIPIYWVLNLVDRRLEIYREPSEGTYGVIEIFGPDDKVPLLIDNREQGHISPLAFGFCALW